MEFEIYRRAFQRQQLASGAGKTLDELVAIERAALLAKNQALSDLDQARARGIREAHTFARSISPTPGTATPAPVAPDQTVTTSPVVSASDAPAKRNRKPSWATVAMPYMKAVFSQGKYKSATVFYKAMLSRADTKDSPFTKSNGELYCAAAGTTVSEGTVGTKWKDIRAG